MRMPGPLALVLCGAALLACGPSPESEPGPDVASRAPLAATLAPARVKTTVVREGPIRALVMASGSVAARRTTDLGPEVPGRLIQIYVDVGDRAEAGAPLFLIDPAPYEIALEAAEARLELAQAELEEARLEAKRVSALARKEMAPQQQHDRARTRVQVARARVAEAQSRKTQAERDLASTLGRAPYAGTVVERRVHEGAMATVRPNTTVVVFQSTEALEARLDIPEASLAAVRTGDRARLYVEGIAEGFESRVRTVSERIDPASRTYEVRVPLDDPGRRVKAGAFVRAEVEPSEKQAVLLIDRDALVMRDGAVLAFRVVDGRAEQVAVRLGIVAEREAEVLSGLAAGDSVVVGDAAAQLVDGAPVAVEDAGDPDALTSSSEQRVQARR